MHWQLAYILPSLSHPVFIDLMIQKLPESEIAKTIVLTLQWPLVKLLTHLQQLLLAPAVQQATSVLLAQHARVSGTALGRHCFTETCQQWGVWQSAYPAFG